MPIFRTEHTLALWGGPETTYGDRATPVSRFGLHDIVEAADPEYDWQPFFGVASGRSRATILRGRQTLRGSIPDIRIQDDVDLQLFAFALGRVSGSSVLEGVSSTDERIDSLTMQIAMRDTDGVYSFIRDYHGGKVNRASWRCEEGQELRYNMDEIIFQHVAHNRSGVANYNASATLGTDPGASGAPRYIWANSTITAFGVTLGRVRRFNLQIDNQLEPRYYLVSGEGGGQHGWLGEVQEVTELIEGKRVYSLEFELDVVDPATDLELLDFMLNQGAASAAGPTLGGTVTLVMRSLAEEGGSSTLTFNCSGSVSAASPGTVIRNGKISIPAPPAGIFPVTYAMDVDTLSIVKS